MNVNRSSKPPSLPASPPNLAEGQGAAHLPASGEISSVTPAALSLCHAPHNQRDTAPQSPASLAAGKLSALVSQLETIATDPKQSATARRLAAAQLERLRASAKRRATTAASLALIEKAKEPERIAQQELAKIEELTKKNGGKPPLLGPDD